MNIEELLKPRVKVTNWYPNCPFEVGSILTYTDGYVRLGEVYSDMVEGDQEWVTKTDVENSPAIFQPLKWWQERKIEDMPEYLKVNGKDILKVKNHFWHISNRYHKDYCTIVDELSYCILYRYTQPATEIEYLNFKATQK